MPFPSSLRITLYFPAPVGNGLRAVPCGELTLCATARNATEGVPYSLETQQKGREQESPADGYYASGAIMASGGAGEDVSDAEIVAGMKLLAETEGILGETAAGVTISTTKKLVAQGKLDPDGETVLAVTGNGLKTLDALQGNVDTGITIRPRLEDFEAQVMHAVAAH